MSTLSYCTEYQSTVPPKKLFTALTENSTIVIPNAVATVRKADIFQVDGVDGINVMLTHSEGNNSRYSLLRFDEIDKSKMSFKYTQFEGPACSQRTSYAVEVKPGPARGSISKITVNCYPNDDPEPVKLILPGSGIFEPIESYITEEC